MITLKRNVFWVFLATMVACTVVLAVHAYQAQQPPSTWWVPRIWRLSGDRLDYALAAGLVLSMILAWWTYRFPRRREPTALILVTTSTLGVLTVVLGLASYVPTGDDGSTWLAPLGWTVGLFLANDATRFDFGPPVGFELAKLFGLMTTASGLLTAAMDTWTGQWQRLQVRLSRDVDVVVGLNDYTVPLLEALVKEADAWQKWEWWHRRFDRLVDLRNIIRRRPIVVAVTADKTNPKIGEARALGARVIVSDLSSEAAARRVLLTPSKRISVRRLYILTSNQSTNVAVLEAAEKALLSASGRGQHLDIVPRIVVSLDDSRSAREWRIETLNNSAEPGAESSNDGTWFRDAVSENEVLSHAIADHIIKQDIEHLIIVGTSMLGVAVLDQLAWQRWARFDLLVSAATVKDRMKERTPEWERMSGLVDAAEPITLQEGSLEWERRPLALREVRFVGRNGRELVDEWERTRPPLGSWSRVVAEGSLEPFDLAPQWCLPHLPVTTAGLGELEQHLNELVGQGRKVMILATKINDSLAEKVHGIARRFPQVEVAVRDQYTSGVTPRSPAALCTTYGPTWLLHDVPLEDSWSAVARHHHAAYRQWNELERKALEPDKVTRLPWDACPSGPQLPGFFRDDNLRQLRHLLANVAKRMDWQAVGGSTPQPPEIPDAVVDEIVEEEYIRWKDLRKRRGWRAGPAWGKPVRNDWYRYNQNMDEDARDANFDEVLIRQLLERLRQTGLAPVPRADGSKRD